MPDVASRSADNRLIAPAGDAVAAGAALNLDRPCGSAKRGESCDCPCRRCRRRRRQRKFRLPRIRAKREEKVNCPRGRRWRPGHRRCHQKAAVLVQEGGGRGGQEVGFSHSWRGGGARAQEGDKYWISEKTKSKAKKHARWRRKLILGRRPAASQTIAKSRFYVLRLPTRKKTQFQ